MKKKISALLIAGILVITGCSFTGSNSSETDRPYDSYFKDAKEWAEFWCGPCEQIDKRKEDCDDNDYYDYIEYYTMKDSEFGFTYTVNAYWKRYGSILNKPKAEYYCNDFDKPYMQEFIKATDFSPITDKYGLTVDIKDDGNGYYIATLILQTDRDLTEEEAGEIFTFVYFKLQDFDSRNHFTKNEYCTSVYIHVRSAPTEEQKELGHQFNDWSRIYGYVGEA